MAQVIEKIYAGQGDIAKLIEMLPPPRKVNGWQIQELPNGTVIMSRGQEVDGWITVNFPLPLKYYDAVASIAIPVGSNEYPLIAVNGNISSNPSMAIAIGSQRTVWVAIMIVGVKA